MEVSWYFSLLGGVLIGLAVTMMLLFNGRVAGISGIIASALSDFKSDGSWRWVFIIGMLFGGATIHVLSPEMLVNTSDRTLPIILFAGLLVGYGTVMGSGCTSGHGICGLSRLSMRSIVATLTFMLFGFLSVRAFAIFFGVQV